MVHCVSAMPAPGDDGAKVAAAEQAIENLLRTSSAWLRNWHVEQDHRRTTSELVYADVEAFADAADSWSDLMTRTPVIPCASLWNARGERLAVVVMCKITLQKREPEASD